MAKKGQTPTPHTPALEIRPRFIWPTPEKANLLFWVEKDGNLPKNQGWTLITDTWRDTTEYPDHKLIYVSPQDERGVSRWYYANNRTLESNYNFEFTQANIGGQTFNAVRRSFLTPRADFSPTAPVAGAAMPRDPSNKFPEGYVLSGRRQQRTGDDIFDGVYVVEVRDYVLKVTTTDIGTDELNGRPLASIDTLYYATEVVTGALTAAALFADTDNTYWGVQEDGTRRVGKQISAEWYLITSEQLVAGTAVGGIVALGEYRTNDDHYWPPVLSEIEFMDWTRRDGGVDIYPRYEYDPDGYRGPCSTLVKRWWSKNPHTISPVVPMLPSPIAYGSPFFRLTIPACLHWAVDSQCDIGSEDPIYTRNSGSTRTTDATNHVTWPSSLITYDDQDPYKGGYLRIQKIMDAPA